MKLHQPIRPPEATLVASDLLLKVTPPRVPPHLVARDGLQAQNPSFLDCPAIVVQAPAGFGKTSLLAQWRREHLSRGSVVAWLSAQRQDDPRRLVESLCLAVRVGAGRPGFGRVLLNSTAPSGLEAITVWLADVAQSALDVVLVVDEADHLPPASRELLAYLVRNAPANLRCVIAARSDCDLGLQDLVAYGQCVTVGAAQLRFTLDETLDLVRSRSGTTFDPDDAARLHEMAEGWPLGMQLALAAMESSGGAKPLPHLCVNGGVWREQFVGFLLRNLNPADLDFLTRVSAVDPLHPGLCEALMPGTQARARLARLARDTPIFVMGEQSEWVRMHALARDALLGRFNQLDEAVRIGVHAVAADWLQEHGMVEAGARHALAAGQPQKAYALAERSLYGALMNRGHSSVVLDWLAQMPADELDRRPRFLLAAAWSLAGSERHEEATRLVARILVQPQVDDELRWECSLILGSAAYFADSLDRFAELHDPWSGAPPPSTNPMLLQVHANRTAFRALLDGESALARLHLQQAPRGPSAYLVQWGELIVGLSYLRDGQVLLAEKLLRPALAAAESALGRRSAFASMLAVILAAALWERDQPEEATTLLANRLDVIERSALPDCVLLAFRTLARMAAASGSEHRALQLLEALDAVGLARRLPRLRIASLVEQTRIHARHFHGETCRELCKRLDAQLADPATPQGPLWQRSVAAWQDLAHGYARIAAQDWRGALGPLARAEAEAIDHRLGRLRLELLGLRALALDRSGEHSQSLLREVLDMARSQGLQRVFADAHPALGEWGRQVALVSAPVTLPVRAAPSGVLRATPSMALTPKEREVLELLARNLSNKEIALALQVVEETIKWHVKNLFAKLDAGTRKQVVSRAHILGLLAKAA